MSSEALILAGIAMLAWLLGARGGQFLSVRSWKKADPNALDRDLLLMQDVVIGRPSSGISGPGEVLLYRWWAGALSLCMLLGALGYALNAVLITNLVGVSVICTYEYGRVFEWMDARRRPEYRGLRSRVSSYSRVVGGFVFALIEFAGIGTILGLAGWVIGSTIA